MTATATAAVATTATVAAAVVALALRTEVAEIVGEFGVEAVLEAHLDDIGATAGITIVGVASTGITAVFTPLFPRVSVTVTVTG